MGMRRTPQMCLANETRSRASQTFKEFTKIRAKIIQCQQLSRSTRLQLGSVFMFSRLFYNAGTWSRLTSMALRPLNRTYMAVLRSVADMKNVEGVRTTDAAVHKGLETLHVRATIMMHRLRYFVRAVKYAPPALLREARGHGAVPAH